MEAVDIKKKVITNLMKSALVALLENHGYHQTPVRGNLTVLLICIKPNLALNAIATQLFIE
jgi:hypothetical protein